MLRRGASHREHGRFAAGLRSGQSRGTRSQRPFLDMLKLGSTFAGLDGVVARLRRVLEHRQQIINNDQPKHVTFGVG